MRRVFGAPVGLSAAALGGGAGLSAYPALAANGHDQLLGAAGIVGLFVLAFALARGARSGVPWAIVAIGGEYAAWVALRGDGVDTRAPLFAGGLFAVAELSYWAIDRRSPARADFELEVRRAVGLLAAATVSIGVGVLLLGASTLSLGGGVGVEALGIAGAVGLAVLFARLARAEPTEDLDR